MATEPSEQWVSLFKADEKIVPRSVWGRFARLRWVMVWLTQLVFYGAAWLQYNGRQALLFDLDAHRFFIGPLVFYPQDFIYLTALLVISALSLFLFTAVAGRVWCGYACPQTVYTEIFLWIERRIEGDRAARLRLARQGFNINRVARTGTKHLAWGMVALYTGFTFVGYFTPIRELSHEVLTLTVSGWETFWILFYGFATYGNAGWMREQVCKYMCPYARFQSAMFDADTLLVTYDERRGEPRGSRGKLADPSQLGLGSCVDCNLCVQVCPTGIDIRKGLQYECIGCAACVDVCDNVMDKMGYERGLVRYGTQNAMTNGWNASAIMRRMIRPRVLIYTAIVWGLIAALAVLLSMRQDLRVDVIRDRNVQYRLVEDGKIENVYRFLLMNTSEYSLKVSMSLPEVNGQSQPIELSDQTWWVLSPTEAKWVVGRLKANQDDLKPGSNPVSIQFDSVRINGAQVLSQSASAVVEQTVLIAPF